ncbi:MAG: methyltransferase domain-containing protein [Chloroflexi bacterium]|nr:MAG: methyltransferase domain-containing protein [Chloroflexota bacterium]
MPTAYRQRSANWWRPSCRWPSSGRETASPGLRRTRPGRHEPLFLRTTSWWWPGTARPATSTTRSGRAPWRARGRVGAVRGRSWTIVRCACSGPPSMPRPEGCGLRAATGRSGWSRRMRFQSRSWRMSSERRESGERPPSARRFDTQVDMLWSQEWAALQQLGLRDGMSVLDIGAGPGLYAWRLLNVARRSQVTLLETDPAMLEQARALLASSGRARVVAGSVETCDLDPASFDFAIARLVLQHVEKPQPLVVAALRLLQPGGTLVLIDADDDWWGCTEPAMPELTALFERYREATGREGRRSIGRRLPRLLRDAGFEQLQAHALVAHSDVSGLEPFLTLLESVTACGAAAHCGVRPTTYGRLVVAGR